MTERERKILLHELRMCRTELDELRQCPLLARPVRTIGSALLLAVFVAAVLMYAMASGR